ncbi:DgyrCDS7792 [Dimorphilus gyrociliatus]|uniref:DgyrCDS7792 n=1 Tax=Dimorphilus gyrociliatus TaxID=2664684 RepID=A0A7I8VTV6_9ANNE|nr:DgyrCDS7792 [Dimorphilus gyrociliatus]
MRFFLSNSQTGDADLPTSKVLEKQKILIDQLTKKLNFQLEDMSKLGDDDLKKIVDTAVGKIVNPAKVKEKLVDQLKTQVTDLERFISFLQGDAQTPGPLGHKCTCPMHGSKFNFDDNHAQVHKNNEMKNHSSTMKEATLSIMKQALTVLQLFTFSQFGCGHKEFKRNLLKRTTKNNHWGDLRARLEISISKVLEAVAIDEKVDIVDSDYTSDMEDSPIMQCNKELALSVRKELAPALRDLLQHGLMEIGQSSSLMVFGCLSTRSKKQTKMMHAWDLFLKYYEMKHGKEYNDSPARKLSQSFHLDIVGGKAITNKQNLLSAIDSVLTSHRPLKRSDDMQFKAFICYALNEGSLVKWLRLVLKSHSLIEYYYQPWSYVVKTGFDDALRSLESLTSVEFRLPVDLAVRPFKNIKDAF